MAAKHLRTVYVADHIVDSLAVDDDLRVPGIDEELHQLLYRCLFVHRRELVARHETVAHLYVGEFECILQQDRLTLHHGIVLCGGILPDVVVEVHLAERILVIALPLSAEELQDQIRQPTGEERDRIEEEVGKGERQRGKLHILIGPRLSHRLGDILPEDDHHGGRDQRLDQHDEESIGHPLLKYRLEEGGKEQPIDHVDHIIRHQDGGDVLPRSVEEEGLSPRPDAPLRPIQLHL